MTNMSKDLVEKVGNMYERMEKFSGVWQLRKKDLHGILQMEKRMLCMKNSVHGLIQRLDTTRERIGKLKDMSLEIIQTETKRE